MQPLPLEVHRPGSQGLRLGELGQVGNREAGVVEKVGFFWIFIPVTNNVPKILCTPQR